MIEKNIPIICPEGCEHFIGSENIINISYEAKYNLKQIYEKFRLFWEEPEEFRKEQDDLIKIVLLNKSSERVTLELEYDENSMREIIKNMISNGN